MANLQKNILFKNNGPGKFILIALLAAAIAYLPVINNNFISYDDDAYITHNADIQQLNIQNAERFFTTPYVANYQPLVMIGYAIQYALFKQQTGWYHIVSLLFHLLNIALVLVITKRLLKSDLAAFITAMLFGLHPLHVESVAWVAAQKDVIYTFFFFLSVYFYLVQKEDARYARRFGGLSLLCFILSLLSKGQAVVLPLVLMPIDYWQNKKITKADFIEKLPYLGLSLLFGLGAIKVQGVAIQDFAYYTPLQRFLFIAYGLVCYLWQTIFPLRLAMAYPYPVASGQIDNYWVYASPFIIASLLVLLYKIRQSSAITVFGSLFFCITIAPVMQFIPVGDSIHADRYTYIPLTGIFIIAGYYFSKYFNEESNRKGFLAACSFIYFFGIGSLTFLQAATWQNSITAYTSSLKNAESYIIYYNRAVEFAKQAKWREAISDYTDALRLNPKLTEVYRNRGVAYESLNDYSDAIADYTKALAAAPDALALHGARGECYNNTGNFEKAVEDYTVILNSYPDDITALFTRAEANRRWKKPIAAIKDLDRVIELKPDNYPAYCSRAMAQCDLNNFESAFKDYAHAINLNPASGFTYFNRSLCYNSRGDYMHAYQDAITAVNYGYNVDKDYLQRLRYLLHK